MATITREQRSYRAEYKAAGDAGEFVGYASIFGNTDAMGDVMEPGAFSRTLAERGLPILSWEHRWELGPIGEVAEAVEDERGLRITGRLYIDDPLVARIYRSLKAGQVQEMSFAFHTVESHDETADGEAFRHVTDVDLFEVALVVLGANPDTEILEVRALTAAYERLGHVAALSTGVIQDKAASPVHHTSLDGGAWNGPQAVAAMPAAAATLRYCHAWRDSEGDPDAKASYKFPHHRRLDGPANMPACRNGMSRLPQASIPDGDRAGVERHLQAHMDDMDQASRAARLVQWRLLDHDPILNPQDPTENEE